MPPVNKYYEERLQPILRTLPDKPGVYQYFDEKGRIIYVGKAKSLKKRVSSYFTSDHKQSGKIRVLVSRIADIRHIVVASEMDALLLENNLIKEHQPRYNIQLKDDKSFPWICIKNEPYPRIFSTRNLIKDGSLYFGPYASGKMMHSLLELIRNLYPLRTCNLNLTQENIKLQKFRVCLEYQIGNCLGPCEGRQTQADYEASINHIRQIIKGNLAGVITGLKSAMLQYAEELKFERAQLIKDKITQLEKYQSKSAIVNPAINNVDVLSVLTGDDLSYVNYLRVINGGIVQAHTVEVRTKLDESREEILLATFIDLRQRFESDAAEIIVPFNPGAELEGIKFLVPQKGDKKKLLELSERNAQYFRAERLRQVELVDPERHVKRVLEKMKQDLRLRELPSHIECFDNSNIQGTDPVSAMVVFRNAKPSKKDYRHYNIRTVTGPDDFATMEEVISRRYRRMLDEKQDIPQLIVIDGGKGQLNAALKALEPLGLREKIAVIGIAKRLEEIYYPGDPVPLHLDKKSETLRIIQQLRDEAHRFGITHHRKRREHSTLKSDLTSIEGIGFKTAQELLRKFKSVKKIKATALPDLQAVIGISKGQLVYDYFRNQAEPG